jgi:hypothetical protein
LGSRIRTRLATEIATRDELLACLEQLLSAAGNASLMTKELRQTLCDHAAGNYRVFTTMAGELLLSAAQRDLPVLDAVMVLARPVTQINPSPLPAMRRCVDSLGTEFPRADLAMIAGMSVRSRT